MGIRASDASALIEQEVVATRGDDETTVETCALVERAQAGDREALGLLWRRYQPIARGVAARAWLLPRGVEPGDVDQEAARGLCELVLSFDAQRGIPIAAYLRSKLAWRVSHYLRSEARRTGHLPLDAVDVEAIPEAVVEEPEPRIANARVARALRRLSPRQRAVIVGLFWRERKARELAADLGVTHQAVAALRRRAEARIRRELQRGDEADEPCGD